jgi:hypothetical protein
MCIAQARGGRGQGTSCELILRHSQIFDRGVILGQRYVTEPNSAAEPLAVRPRRERKSL